VWAVDFFPDGETGLSGGSDRSVRRWKTSSALLAQGLCALVGRGSAPEGWREYLPPDLELQPACPESPARAGSDR
jgi:WD40 repeat protein